MSCKICEELPTRTVRSLNKHLKRGKYSLKKIARHYKVSAEDLTGHLRCMEQGTDETQELVRAHQQITSLLKTLREEIDANDLDDSLDDEFGENRSDQIRNYLAAMRESREIVMALSRLRSGEEIYRELRDNVIDPLIKGLTIILVDESKRLRDELFDIAKQDSKQHPRITQTVNEMLERAADRFSTEAMTGLNEKVQAVVTKRKTPQKSVAPTTH